MLECDLSAPCEAWLRSRGFTPYAEVVVSGGPTDWIATADDGRLCCVEMKRGLTRKVMCQAQRMQLVTPDVWCFVGTKPRSTSVAERIRLGVAWWDGATVRELVQPQHRVEPIPAWVARAWRRCRGKLPGGLSGCPTMLGVGPAQDVFDRIAAYKADRPAASWREVFASVPNHYQHAESLRGAMQTVKAVRLQREQAAACRAVGASLV